MVRASCLAGPAQRKRLVALQSPCLKECTLLPHEWSRLCSDSTRKCELSVFVARFTVHLSSRMPKKSVLPILSCRKIKMDHQVHSPHYQKSGEMPGEPRPYRVFWSGGGGSNTHLQLVEIEDCGRACRTALVLIWNGKRGPIHCYQQGASIIVL